MTDDVLENDGYCFGCGPSNPIGLKLAFQWNDDKYSALWTPVREHQGWAGRVHGGFLALVLDEALSRAALERHGLHWVTTELTTRRFLRVAHPPSVLDKMHMKRVGFIAFQKLRQQIVG